MGGECGSQPKNGKSQRNFLCSPKMRLDRTARLLTNRPLIIAMLEIFTKGNYPLQKCNVGFQCEDERFKRTTMSETILRSYAQNDLEIGMAEKYSRFVIWYSQQATPMLHYGKDKPSRYTTRVTRNSWWQNLHSSRSTERTPWRKNIRLSVMDFTETIKEKTP